MTLKEIEGKATISVEQAAELLGIGRSAAYEAVRRGQLPTRRLGRRLFVPVPALLRWLEQHPNESHSSGTLGVTAEGS